MNLVGKPIIGLETLTRNSMLLGTQQSSEDPTVDADALLKEFHKNNPEYQSIRFKPATKKDSSTGVGIFKNLKLKTFTNQFCFKQDPKPAVEMRKTSKGYRAPLLVQGGKLGYMDRRRLGRNERRGEVSYPDHATTFVRRDVTRGSPADMQL